MTGDEREELREVVEAAVKEAMPGAVANAMPEALGEALGPLIHAAVQVHTRSWRRRATAGFLILAVAFGYLFFDSRDQSSRINAALCTFRHDIEMRVAGSEKFLADHPQGFAGIPAATIRVSLDGQKRTIRALASLKCPTPRP